MNRRTIGIGAGLGIVVLASASILLWFILQAWAGEIQPPLVNAVAAGVTAVATVLLAALTGLYVWNTSRLLETSRAQVSVMRASYAPVLDTNVDPQSDYLRVIVNNVGDGAARDISLIFDLSMGSDVFRYVGNIPRSLGPGDRLVGGLSGFGHPTPEESLHILPRFRVDSEIVHLGELLEKWSEEDYPRPRLQFNVRCRDSVGEEEYAFTGLESKFLSYRSDLKSAFSMDAGDTIYVRKPPPESIRDHVGLAYRKVRSLWESPEEEGSKPVSVFEEDIDSWIA